METIKNYLDNLFAGMIKTAEITKLKEDLLANMEDKYIELKEKGKSENEAIGIVISEFGNIDELVRELNIDSTASYTEALPHITREEADSILHSKKIFGNTIAFGVWLCIMAPAVFVILSSGYAYNDNRMYYIPLFPFFIMIAIAVALFIFSGLQLDKYEYLKKPFYLDISTIEFIKIRKEAFHTTYTVQIILGVMLCILSPLMLIGITSISSSERFGSFGIFVLLTMVAIAVFLFIHTGCIMDSYKELLQEAEFSKKAKKGNKIVDVVASIIWPIVTAGYLIVSFVTGDWHITWIVFPVVGILFGAFAAVVNAVKGGDML